MNCNARKGHQGFIKNYRNLGDTKHMRVPLSVVDEIKRLLIVLESIADKKGMDGVNLALDKVIHKLQKKVEE